MLIGRRLNDYQVNKLTHFVRWDTSMAAVSLRSYFSPCVIVLSADVRCFMCSQFF